MKITIDAEPFDSADGLRLVAALDAHLAGLYSPDQRFGPNLKPEHLAPGLGTFVMARADGVAIGCGALRRLDETTAEVKRMYVEPALRGRGRQADHRPPLPPGRIRPDRLFRRIRDLVDERLLREEDLAGAHSRHDHSQPHTPALYTPCQLH